DCRKHLSYFAIFALGYGYMDFSVIFICLHYVGFTLFGDITAVDFNAAADGIEGSLSCSALYFDEVSFGHFVGRMGQPLRKFSVCRQNKKSLTVVIEPAYGINSADVGRQQIENSPPALVVRDSGKIT